MGSDSGAGEGQTGPKRHFKHIGELVDGGSKVVIVYRTVPGEPDNCLVVGTKFLPDLYHNSLMKAVEGTSGQDADELADYLGRQTFPDGTNMLAMLHNDNYNQEVQDQRNHGHFREHRRRQDPVEQIE